MKSVLIFLGQGCRNEQKTSQDKPSNGLVIWNLGVSKNLRSASCA